MGWFDDQIEYRKKHERELLSDSFENIARSVTGRKIRSSVLNERRTSATPCPPCSNTWG